MARIANSTRERQPLDDLSAEVLEYSSVKGQVDDLEKRKRTLRDSIIETVKIVGEPDDKGHLWLELDAEVGGISALQAERRVSQTLNEERAQEILAERGLLERCTKTVTVIDHDAVMAALYDDSLAEADIDEMFDNKITWALKVK